MSEAEHIELASVDAPTSDRNWDRVVSSVRVLVTLGFSAATIIGAFIGKVDWKEITTVTVTLVAFWFGERAALKIPARAARE